MWCPQKHLHILGAIGTYGYGISGVHPGTVSARHGVCWLLLSMGFCQMTSAGYGVSNNSLQPWPASIAANENWTWHFPDPRKLQALRHCLVLVSNVAL